MTRRLDPDRTIEEWLIEGPNQLPDRVLGSIVDRLDHTKQRGPGWLPRRHDMNRSLLSLGGLAAAVAVAVIGGALFLGLGTGRPGVGGPPSPSPSPSPTASPAPSVTPSFTPQGQLPEGPHVLWERGLPMTVTIPAAGWYGQRGDGILQKDNNVDAPNGAGMIVFADASYYVYSDPCRWSTTRPDTPATTVDALVAALSAQKTRNASEPAGVTLDGHAGKSITLHVPGDAVHSGGGFTGCDQGNFASWGVQGEDPARWHQGPGQIDKLWIVDVDGKLAVIDIAYYPGTPQAVVNELEAMVASLTFE